jgi:hypothetical protein
MPHPHQQRAARARARRRRAAAMSNVVEFRNPPAPADPPAAPPPLAPHVMARLVAWVHAQPGAAPPGEGPVRAFAVCPRDGAIAGEAPPRAPATPDEPRVQYAGPALCAACRDVYTRERPLFDFVRRVLAFHEGAMHPVAPPPAAPANDDAAAATAPTAGGR